MSLGELLDVYNADGVFQKRSHVRGAPVPVGDHHLCVHIWLRSLAGNYLIQERAWAVAASPGMWATTAGGVRAGETPLTAAVRELAEEIGLVVEPTALERLFESRKDHLIATVWLVRRADETDRFSLQPEEVASVKWSTPADIEAMVRVKTFVDYGAAYFAQLFGHA